MPLNWRGLNARSVPRAIDPLEFDRDIRLRRASDGTFYYVMEYLPGMNLEEVVRKFGPMPEARIVHILKQVCEAYEKLIARV